MTALTDALPVTDRLRMKEAVRRAQVSRPTLYNWIKEGRFHSWVVKRRGRENGIRFIDRASFEAFLSAQREEAV